MKLKLANLVPKLTILAHLEALNFYDILHFLMAKIYQLNKIQSPKMAKTAVLALLNSPKLISRKNLSNRKMLKFVFE